MHLFVTVHHNINIGHHVFSNLELRIPFSFTQDSTPVSEHYDFIYSDTVDGGVVFSLPVKPTKKRRRTI